MEIYGFIDIIQMALRPTIDSPVKQQEEFCNSAVHLPPVEVKQRNHLEVHLSEQVGQLVHISDRCTQLSVVEVVHVADQESNFVCCCRRDIKQREGTTDLKVKCIFHSMYCGYVAMQNLPWKYLADEVGLSTCCCSNNPGP